MNSFVWRNVFGEIILVMFFQSMSIWHGRWKSGIFLEMFLLSLHKQICKSESNGLIFLGRVSKNGTKLTLKLVFTQGNEILQWKQGSYFLIYLKTFFLSNKIEKKINTLVYFINLLAK